MANRATWRFSVVSVARSLGSGLLVGSLTSVVAVMFLVVAWTQPWALVMVALVGAMLFFALRVYGSLTKRFNDLEALYAFGRGVEALPDAAGVAEGLLMQARELLRAEVAEIVFTEIHDRGRRLRLTSDSHPSMSIVPSDTDEDLICGLYSGASLIERSVSDPPEIPEHIHLFREGIIGGDRDHRATANAIHSDCERDAAGSADRNRLSKKSCAGRRSSIVR